jgi:carboxylesterase type B
VISRTSPLLVCRSKGHDLNSLLPGESAGAASIIHHLTAYGGKQDTLFKKAVLQSPGFVQMFDRRGLFETIFHNFTAAAGCPKDGGLACIRAASKEALVRANEKVQKDAVPGSFSVGPAPDGKWVRQLASIEAMHGRTASSHDLYLLGQEM